jgi:TolA-binding protein
MKFFRCFFVITLLSPAIFALEKEGDFFFQAEAHFRAQKYDLALDRYDAFLRTFPSSNLVADAQFRRGVILFRLNRYGESLDLFNRIAIRYKSTRYYSILPFWKGLLQYHVGDYESSVRELSAYLEGVREPETAGQAFLYRGMGRNRLGDRPGAYASLKEYLETVGFASAEGYALSLYASIAYSLGDLSALAKLEGSAVLDRLDPVYKDRILLVLAETRLSRNETAEALKILGGIEKGSPEIAILAFRRSADILFGSGRSDEVGGLVRRAEERLSGTPGELITLWLRAGMGAFQAGKPDESEYYLRRIWDRRFSETVPPEAVLYLAEILRSTSRSDNAVSILREYVEKTGPRGADVVMLRLGELEAERGSYGEAEKHLSSFMQNHPHSDLFVRGAYARGFALYRLGRLESALEVTEELFSRGSTGDYAPKLFRLQAQILSRLGKPEEALAGLRNYVSAVPGDLAARLDTLRLLFILRDYRGVLEGGTAALRDFPSPAERVPILHAGLIYLLGMADLNLGEYSSASLRLSSLGTGAFSFAPRELLSSAAFYAGWALYRQARYEEALRSFQVAIQGTDPGGDLFVRASYYAAWCAYSLGRYEAAAALVSALAADPGNSVFGVRSAFLLGNAYQASGRYREAMGEFRRIFVSHPDSEPADEARYEYAGLFVKIGDPGRAEREYLEFFEAYPNSPLREEALFKRGEVLFAAKNWDDAGKAFHRYRSEYPGGKYVDQALYWGGAAAFNRGEKHGALLLWENLADRHRTSSFRPESLRRIADIYAELGEYSRAILRYTEIVQSYPKDAEAFDTKRKIAELRLIKDGSTSREAALSVRIGRAGGAASADGRTAMLELARLYVYEGSGKAAEDMAEPLLGELRKKTADDPKRAAEAVYLLGELQRRRQKYGEAGTLYLEAASAPGADPDLVARCLLRGAEMMLLSGRPGEAAPLVDLLKRTFPGTEWSAEGEKLLSRSKRP